MIPKPLPFHMPAFKRVHFMPAFKQAYFMPASGQVYFMPASGHVDFMHDPAHIYLCLFHIYFAQCLMSQSIAAFV